MPISEKRRRGRPRSDHGPGDAGPVQSLDRGLRVLAHVAGGDGLSLSEIAAACALPPATAYRMLTTLQAHGMVEFDEAGQLWSVGVETFRMGAAFLRRRKLVDRARAVMQRLVEQSGETANLGVAEEDCVVFVSQVETHQAIRAFFRPGTRSPFHASGIGKAILSHMDGAEVEALAGRAPLEAYTDNTLTALDALTTDLRRARDLGYAVDDEERYAGMRCVAAATFNEHGEPVGGVSLSGPTVRVSAARMESLGRLVVEGATEITRAIGGVGPGRIVRHQPA